MTRRNGRSTTTLQLVTAAIAVSLEACDARIGEPQALWALWLLPALAVFYLLSFRSRAARLRRFASPPMIERLTGGAGPRRGALKAGLVVAAVIAMLVALAHLQMGYTWEEVERRGVDIVVALDVSDSMRVEDAGRELSRLERAKREIHDLLQLLSGDRVGIVAFAGTAFVQCPMTLDYGAAELFLAALDSESIPVQGTDLAQALEMSLKAFRGGAAGSRAVLLITDGEDHSGRAVEVAQRLRAEGVRVFAIGIGSADGAPIPAQGGGFRRDRRGDIILSRLDEPTLQQIALTTDGRYVRSVSGDLDLEQIYVEGIKATLEDREFEAHRRQRWEDRFQWLLGAALAALMIEALVPERAGARRRRQASRAAEGVAVERTRPRAAAAAIALAMVALAPQRVGGQAQGSATPAALPRDSGDAVAQTKAPARFDTPEEAYQAGDFAQALEGFLDLQVERPEDAAVTMNVGSAHYRLGDLEGATRSFETAGTTGDDGLRAQAWYDLGNVAYRQGRLEEAIESYHHSLDLDPGDQDAKFNLEVTRAALERQQEQQKQSSSNGAQPQPGAEGERSPQQDAGDPSQQQPSDGDDRQRRSSSSAPEQQNGPGEPQPAEDGGEQSGRQDPQQAGDETGAEDGRGGDQAAATGVEPGQAAEGQLTATEAERLLDGLEEGRPRRRVPPGRHRDQEKDW